MASSPATLRSLYRSLLRELPPRPILASPRSSLHDRIRTSFTSTEPSEPSSSSSSASSTAAAAGPSAHYAAHAAAQAVAYIRSQRMYVALIERYNPGMEMSQDERIRLTARRVGMDLPVLNKSGEGK